METMELLFKDVVFFFASVIIGAFAYSYVKYRIKLKREKKQKEMINKVLRTIINDGDLFSDVAGLRVRVVNIKDLDNFDKEGIIESLKKQKELALKNEDYLKVKALEEDINKLEQEVKNKKK
jgi:Na+-translocating ferredoxin:NAD+ oxidoreductase RnfG subunit